MVILVGLKLDQKISREAKPHGISLYDILCANKVNISTKGVPYLDAEVVILFSPCYSVR